MSDIVEFLRARLHEDEAAANGTLTDVAMHRTLNIPPHWLKGVAKRALQEVEAKHQMIEVAGQMAATVDGEWGCCHTGEQIISAGPNGCDAYHTLEQVLEPLARIYSEHPDFDPEWAEGG